MLRYPRLPPSKWSCVPSSFGVGHRWTVFCRPPGDTLPRRLNTLPFSWAFLRLCHRDASGWLCFRTPCLPWRPYWTPVLGQGRSSPLTLARLSVPGLPGMGTDLLQCGMSPLDGSGACTKKLTMLLRQSRSPWGLVRGCQGTT
jgi:hypothetical protein